MNLFDVRLGCHEQGPKQPAVVDVVVVWPATGSFVVDGTTELDGDRRTRRPGIGIRVKVQKCLMNVRHAFGIHELEASVP